MVQVISMISNLATLALAVRSIMASLTNDTAGRDMVFYSEWSCHGLFESYPVNLSVNPCNGGCMALHNNYVSFQMTDDKNDTTCYFWFDNNFNCSGPYQGYYQSNTSETGCRDSVSKYGDMELQIASAWCFKGSCD